MAKRGVQGGAVIWHTITSPFASRLVSRIDPKDQQTVYAYNLRNELTTITYPGPVTVTFDYDAVGNRTEMVDSTGTTTYEYDALDRLESVTFPGSRSVGYAYDAIGRRTSITYPGGSDEVTYAYDEASNLVSVTDWNDDETIYEYDDAGLLTTETYPNGVVGTFDYDNADRLTGIDWKKGANTLAFVDYTLDAVGNRTQRVDGLGTHVYEYDKLYRITNVDYPGADETDYTYDAVGNRKTMVTGAGTTQYAYDAADRLTSVTPPGAGAISYTFDDNGNLTDRGSDDFVWDAEDRLTSATVDSVTTTFTYNGDGLRDSLTVNSNTTTFTWDVNRSIPQVLDDDDFRYVYGVGRTSQVGGSETHYYLSDGLGSTMALTNETGTVVNDYDYDVFGQLRDSSGSQPNDFMFASEQVDGSTGLQYLRTRYYDIETGTFISKDPMAANPFWLGHAFTYADGQPTDLRDPNGLDPDPEREPEGIAFPPIGNQEDRTRCRNVWENCISSWFIDEMMSEMNRKKKRIYESDIHKACNDFYNACLRRVETGEEGYMDLDQVRDRIRSMVSKTILDDIRDFIPNPPRIPIKLPSTGSGGLLDNPESESGVTLCWP